MPFVSQRRSLIEAMTNTGLNFVITPVLWLLVVIPVLDIDPPILHSVALILMFAATSTLRTYLVRRYFNRRNK